MEEEDCLKELVLNNPIDLDEILLKIWTVYCFNTFVKLMKQEKNVTCYLTLINKQKEKKLIAYNINSTYIIDNAIEQSSILDVTK